MGHHSRTAGADYTRATGDHGAVTREAMHQYYLVSTEWHELFWGSSKSMRK